MDGQTATLVDDLNNSRTESAPTFYGALAVSDFSCDDDLFNAFRNVSFPHCIMGVGRLGGLGSSPFTAHRGRAQWPISHFFDDDVPLPFHAKPSLQELAFSEAAKKECVVGVPAAAAACAKSIEATIAPAPSEVSVAAHEANHPTVSGAGEEYSEPKLTDTVNSEHGPTIEQFRRQFQRLHDLSKLAANGDQAAIAEIQHILDTDDILWRHLGDVERTTEAMLVELLAGSSASKESVRRSVLELRQSLLGKNSTPLERMAVGRVVACWLFAHFVDRWCGWAVKHSGHTSGLPKLLEACEKRLQTALKSLKLVQGIES